MDKRIAIAWCLALGAMTVDAQTTDAWPVRGKPGSSAAVESVASPHFANAIAQARESAWKAITSGQGSGVSVAIMERGKFVYSEGVGVADRERNRASELTYEDGYFYGPGGDTRFYFVTREGQDLLAASTMGLVVDDTVMFQKLEPAHPPLALEVTLRDEAWLIRNAPPWMEMFNEWRAVAQGTGLRFGVPGGRSRVVVAAADTVLYDSLVDGNEVYAPAGSYLFFAGSPGDTLRVERPVWRRLNGW